MSFDGDQYAESGATVVMTTKGDLVRYDSARERLGIGSTNEILTVSAGGLPTWAASGAAAPTTTKGDISGYSTTQARIPVGTNNYTILADSAQALGLKYAASSTSTLTTTGDLLAASAANVLTRIGAGASGEVLTGNGAGVLPTFQAAGGGSVWTADGTDSGDKAALNVASMTGRDITHIFYQIEPSTLATSAYARFNVNGISTSTYDCCVHNQYVSGATDTNWNQTATGYFLGYEDGHTSEYQYEGDIYLYKGIATQEAKGNFMTIRGLTYRNDQPHMSYIVYGGGYQPDDSAITDISFTLSSGNISGKIQVNSMDYQ